MMRAHKFVFVYEILIVMYISAVCATNAGVEDIDEKYMQQLLRNLNMSVDPCEDFYAYACGNWAQHYDDDDAYVDVPGYMDHEVNKQLLNALLADRVENKGGVVRQAWRYYESCVNLSAPALNTFLRHVQHALHFEWPILRADWQRPWRNATQFDWLRIVSGLRSYGLNGVFITQDVNVRLTNATHYMLELHAQQSPAAAPPSLILRQQDVEGIFINFGLAPPLARNVSAGVIALDKSLNDALRTLTLLPPNTSNVSEANITRTNFTSLEMNVHDLEELVPQIDWRRYLQHTLGREVHLEQQLLHTYSYDLPYFRKLPALLAAHSNETIAYYIMLKFMYQLTGDLPTGMSDAQKSTHCMRLLRGYMPLAANYLYEDHYYKHRRMASDAALHRIFNKLRDNFALLVDANTLQLDDAERAYILAELDGMQLRIGNVPHGAVNLTSEVEAYYANIAMNSSDFYGNHLQLIHSGVRRMQAKLLNTPRAANATAQQQIYEHNFETSTSSSPVKIFDNVVLVPYGYLQLPLYDHRLDALFQYSLFGFILAHEIMHAYDLFHIIYDQHGNFNTLGLHVAQHYWSFINCTRQTELNDVLSENMADVAGLRLAYQTYFGLGGINAAAERSYNIAADEQKADARIESDTSASSQQQLVIGDNEFPNSSAKTSQIDASPHLWLGNFTRPQLFFINSVQFLCANMPRIVALNVLPLHLGHDMHDVRVRRNWLNVEHFANAFQCARDTPMNPTEKCRWW